MEVLVKKIAIFLICIIVKMLFVFSIRSSTKSVNHQFLPTHTFAILGSFPLNANCDSLTNTRGCEKPSIEKITSSGMEAFQKNNRYGQGVGFEFNFFPWQKIGFLSNISHHLGGWYTFQRDQCEKYSGTDCGTDINSDILFSVYSAQAGLIYRHPLPFMLFESGAGLEFSGGYFTNLLTFTDKNSRKLFNATFPDQTSHSWFLRALFSLQWAISENAQTKQKFGIILHIGFGVKNSTLQLPGVAEPLNGLMIDYIAKVGLYL